MSAETNGAAAPPTRRPMGRRTDATMDSWESIRRAVPPIPATFRGRPPSRSPGLRRYRNPRRATLWQRIGMCVGAGVTSMAETADRTPEPLAPGSPPLGGRSYSALWCYGAARAYSRAHGIDFGNEEGAIVAHAHLAMRERGFMRLRDWPDDPASQDPCAGPAIDHQFAQMAAASDRESRDFPIGEVARLASFDQMLQLLGSGYTVAIGVQWPISAMDTAPDGSARWSPEGIKAGGHCVEVLDYDIDADRISLGNSWPGWGLDGIGTVSLRRFAETYSPARMSSGESEAIVIRNIAAGTLPIPHRPWGPKIDWSGAW